ncbi:MAG: transglycosylase SLT domain-containing protein, partial [Desulfobacterales bacterium]
DKGAYGLMQLTSRMAVSLDVKDIFDPEQNIEGGTRFLRELYDHFDKASGSDRLFIAIAAYNIGLGHIWDARDLARERNLDPNRWSSLVETLPLLMYYKYNKNTKHGYARGTEPVRYIKQIVIYYDILKHQSIEYQAAIASPRKEV